MHPWTLYALEVTKDREREREHRAIARRGSRRDSRSAVSPPPADGRSLLAAVSRGTAAAVRRLDDCVADDLGRSLAATK